jgi:hypothetical protein
VVGYGSPIRKCSAKVPGGVSSTPHQPTSSTSASAPFVVGLRPHPCQHQQAAPRALPPPPHVLLLPAPPTVQLIIGHTSTPYMIPSPGGNVTTKQLVMATPLNLVGRLYKTILIVLDGQAINVILGMGWMKGHKVVLDIAARTVYLESSIHGIYVL